MIPPAGTIGSAIGEATAADFFPGCELVALDFESARLRHERGDVPVQIGLVGTRDGELDWASAWSSYLHPPGPVMPGPGLRDEALLRDSPTLLDCWPELRDRLGGRILLAHGAGTEKRFLRAFPGHGFGPWIDTLRLSRAVWPGASSHSLGDLCSHLGVTETLRQRNFPGDWHDALFDAAACLLLFFSLLRTIRMTDPEGGPTGSASASASAHVLELISRPDLRPYFKNRRPPSSRTGDA